MNPDLTTRLLRVGAFAAAIGALWLVGLGLARLRPPRAAHEIRYAGGVMGVGAVAAGFGVGAIWVHVLGLPGWGSPIAWPLAGLCFAAALAMALIVFRYRVIVSDAGIEESRVFRLGRRRIAWSQVRGWKPGRRPGSIELQLTDGRGFGLSGAYKEGFDALLDAIDARSLPEL